MKIKRNQIIEILERYFPLITKREKRFMSGDILHLVYEAYEKPTQKDAEPIQTDNPDLSKCTCWEQEGHLPSCPLGKSEKINKLNLIADDYGNANTYPIYIYLEFQKKINECIKIINWLLSNQK